MRQNESETLYHDGASTIVQRTVLVPEAERSSKRRRLRHHPLPSVRMPVTLLWAATVPNLTFHAYD